MGISLPGDWRAAGRTLNRAYHQLCQENALERATGLEPATSSLGSWHSTTELRPPWFRSSPNLVEHQKKKCPGLVLLSHSIGAVVPSALEGLTAVFGMGTGVALSR